jgi:SAM-dependent methyltransferase
VLTVDFERFPIGPADRVLDLGCGAGRHAFEVLRRGANVVALDLSDAELGGVAGMLWAMREAGEAPDGAGGTVVRADALRLPFPDGAFTRVIASEILEHVPDDRNAIREITRVLRPGGIAAVTVPRWWPERVCWALSERYHNVPGGHVRIYARRDLVGKLRRTGLTPVGTHHAHALHAPYWWLKCLLGEGSEDHRAVQAYYRLLVWDIERRPAVTRTIERALNPVLGKSLVLYLRKPREAAAGANASESNAAA